MAGAVWDFPNQQVVRADGSGPGIETVAPVLTSLLPTTAVVGAANLTLQCNGTGMTTQSVIVFDGADMATTFVSPTQVTCTITPSTATAGSVDVAVRNGNEPSNTRPFTFTATGLAFDPADATVDEVKTYVDTNPDERQAVLDAEVSGKNRSTLVGWLEEQSG
jgi:IPT/TIG domain